MPTQVRAFRAVGETVIFGFGGFSSGGRSNLMTFDIQVSLVLLSAASLASCHDRGAATSLLSRSLPFSA
jgi:hypothetical protein